MEGSLLDGSLGSGPTALLVTEPEGSLGPMGVKSCCSGTMVAFFPTFKTSLSGCPRAKKSGAKVAPTKDDKEDPELMK